MSKTLRIAILECDTPVPLVEAKLGSYGNIFEILLKSGADLLKQETGQSVDLQITKWDIVNKSEYPDLDEVDAVLLTGSKHNSFDNAPWILKLVDYTKKILYDQDRVKIIGICFGHQIVGRAMGAKVARSDKGWEVSVTPMQLTDKGKEIFGLGRDDMYIHQMHQDIVYEYPEGVESLAHSPKCSTQGFYKKGKVITVQGHPEFTNFITSAILDVRHDLGVLKDDIYDDAKTRVGNKHDGVVASKAFLQFVLEG
ncbi:Glutamine amidotransferase-like protein 3 [Elsinoe fawcettii]|nr:Glutamine amidotransferase-like protein 3 [Elsinoe fawcettii]